MPPSCTSEPLAGYSHPKCRLLADIVAKVFWRRRTKILRAAGAVDARRCGGPYRLIRNRSRTVVVAFEKRCSGREGKKSTFARFLGSSDFRLLQQYLPQGDIGHPYSTASLGGQEWSHPTARWCIKRGPMPARRQSGRRGSPRNFVPSPRDVGRVDRAHVAPAPAADSLATSGAAGPRANHRHK